MTPHAAKALLMAVVVRPTYPTLHTVPEQALRRLIEFESQQALKLVAETKSGNLTNVDFGGRVR